MGGYLISGIYKNSVHFNKVSFNDNNCTSNEYKHYSLYNIYTGWSIQVYNVKKHEIV